jgi:protein TonB
MRIQIAASALAIAAALMVSPALAGRAHIDTSHDNRTIYPTSSQAAGEEGLVKIQAYVRPNGRATRVRIVESTGYNDLDRAAIQTVMNWRFVPATQNGEAVSDWTDLQIAYRLPESAKK